MLLADVVGKKIQGMSTRIDFRYALAVKFARELTLHRELLGATRRKEKLAFVTTNILKQIGSARIASAG